VSGDILPGQDTDTPLIGCPVCPVSGPLTLLFCLPFAGTFLCFGNLIGRHLCDEVIARAGGETRSFNRGTAGLSHMCART
jgi:hypothetical protein